MYRIGIDLGGTNIAVGVVDDRHNIIAEASVPTGAFRPAEEMVADMSRAVEMALDKAGLIAADCASIGIGSPGTCDSEAGTVLRAYNLGWFNVPVCQMLHDRFGIPVHLSNDANCAALAEIVAGAAVGRRDMILITLGTGVGGGIIIDGKIYAGMRSMGAELGHTLLVLEGEHCTCGRDGCWEAYASATALIRQGKEAAASHPDSLLNRYPALTGRDVFDAADDGEARKVLAECGYPEGGSLDQALAAARADVFRDMESAVPDRRLVEIFQLKYDYHNAKTLIKAAAMGRDPQPLLLPGGRYDPAELAEGWRREELRGCSPAFQTAMAQAKAVLEDSHDPQQADLILDRACYAEMELLARDLDSRFLQRYVRLLVDVANLRTAVRVHRMGREPEFLRQVLLPGGSVSEQSIAAARADALGELFAAGSLAQAAQLGAKLAHPGAGAMTDFERACDDAVTAYLASERRVPFGEEPVVGYLYAREAEFTAIRTIFAGRAAKLEGDVIRRRLRETYV